MTTADTITGRIKLIERENNSVNGNPRYSLTIELSSIDGTPVATRVGVDWRSNTIRVKTASDASVNYEITNPEFRDVPVLFTMSKRGFVMHAKPIEMN